MFIFLFKTNGVVSAMLKCQQMLCSIQNTLKKFIHYTHSITEINRSQKYFLNQIKVEKFPGIDYNYLNFVYLQCFAISFWIYNQPREYFTAKQNPFSDCFQDKI